MALTGQRILRREDRKLLTKGGDYIDSLKLENPLWATFVRSTEAHAKIRGIETEEAKAAPGVVAVFTAADLDIPPIPTIPLLGDLPKCLGMPILAADKVRYVGEPVAIVITENRYQGPDAVELVFVDYAPLPAVIDVEEALDSDSLLYPEVGSNLIVEMPGESSDDFFDGCDVVVRQRMVNSRMNAAPIEPRAVASSWDDAGNLTQYAMTQGVHVTQAALAGGFEIPTDKVHVIGADTGGSFGAKMRSYPEDIAVPWAARRLRRTVKWVETRTEAMLCMTQGRAQIHYAELGGSRDGRILAYRLKILQDAGAYVRMSPMMPHQTRRVCEGVYDIPKVECSAKTVVTNKAHIGAFRGAGRPEANAAIERMLDLLATEIGMDPVEIRAKNMIPKDAFPYTTRTGTVYDSGDYETALRRTCEAADYPALLAEQKRRNSAGGSKLMGIGVAAYVEVTGGFPLPEMAMAQVREDGSAVITIGRSPTGQAHETTWAIIASDELGIPMDSIDVVHSDTDAIPSGNFSAGSSSVQIGGMAVLTASIELIQKSKEVAAQELGVELDEIVLDKDDGRFHASDTAAGSMSWSDVAKAGGDDGIRVTATFERKAPTFPFGAALVVVEIDKETGGIRLERIVAVDDAGRLINPMVAEGQVHGALATGIGQALFEEVRYDPQGNPQTTSFADYLLPSAADLPYFEALHMETPSPLNALGAKGVGESGTMASTPAIQNAVVDALRSYGVKHIDMPCTPERIWRAIQGA